MNKFALPDLQGQIDRAFGRAPEPIQHEHPMPGQELYKLDHFDTDGTYSEPARRKVDDLNHANLISSEVKPLGWLGDKGMHKPILDLDIPAKLIPSSTPGHFHLYIDHAMPWDDYRDLLEVLGRVGILQPGFVGASTDPDRKATFVRLPWVRKDDA